MLGESYMQYGTICFQTIYQAIEHSYPATAPPPPLPERQDAPYISYRRAYKRVLKSVPISDGVYLWYASLPGPAKEPVYVGESHHNKQGLRGRLDDEFRRSYHGFWAFWFRTDKYLNETLEVFTNPAKYKPKKSYVDDIRNDFARRGATHLVYCSDIPGDQVFTVQNDLIQLYRNPRGNIKDRRDKPLPDSQLLEISRQVYVEFNRIVNETAAF
jgi:hypothetical protein